MTLLEQIAQQRIRFLRKNYPAPNLVVIPYELRHQFMGEVMDFHQVASREQLTVMGMAVAYAHNVPRVQVALHLGE